MSDDARLQDVRRHLPGDGPGFLASIQEKAELVRAGHAAGLAVGAPGPAPAGLAFAGMGFSGLAADLAMDAAARCIDLPVSIVKGYDLPRHVHGDWHTLAVSYSGGTEETLQVTGDARERGTRVAAFTTGGAVAELADTVVTQPKGYQPRAACAYTWFSILGYLSGSGLLPEIPVDAVRAAVQEVDRTCGPDVAVENNPAMRLALILAPALPQIYATPDFYAVGLHFRGMLNENAKKIARMDRVPECNHNDLTGWSGDVEHRERFAVVALHQAKEHPQVQRRLEYMQKRYAQWGVQWCTHALPAISGFEEHVVEQARAMQFLDYTSVYVSALRGVDPADIEEIKALKAHLAT